MLFKHRGVHIHLSTSGAGGTEATGYGSSTSKFFGLAAGVNFDGLISAALVFCGFSLFAVSLTYTELHDVVNESRLQSQLATFAVVLIMLLFLVFAEKNPLEISVAMLTIISEYSGHAWACSTYLKNVCDFRSPALVVLRTCVLSAILHPLAGSIWNHVLHRNTR